MDQQEQWKDVVGFEGLYMVSNYARFKGLERVVRPLGRSYVLGDRIVKSQVNKYGYVKVPLMKGDKKYNIQVHRLVAMSFIPNPENKPQVDHIDGNRSNNRVDNLRWCTLVENVNFPLSKRSHAEAIERQRIAVVQLDMDGNFIAEHVSGNQACRDLGLYTGTVSLCINGKRKSTDGFRFMRKEDYELMMDGKIA